MKAKTKIQAIDADPKQRILAVSDIHGHADWLDQLLKKAKYSSDDILVIVGDLIEKGPNSLGTVRYIMDLCKKNQVYVSMGNADLNRIEQLDDNSEGAEERFFQYLCQAKKRWGSSIFTEMLEQLGYSYSGLKAENCKQYRTMICENFEKELSFLRDLPTILTMENYIFVHGGIPTADRAEELVGTDADPYLKNDHFMEKGFCFSKYVVVGHWPVCLYRKDREDVSPYFNQRQHIISIDGGCGIKTAGQLNLLIIPNKSAAMEEISWISYDSFPVIIAKEEQKPAAATVHPNWFDGRVKRIEQGKELSKYCHLSTGAEFFAPSDGEYKRNGELYYDDYCNAKLSVKLNDELSVIYKTSKGCYVKKNGEAGWYFGKYEDKMLLEKRNKNLLRL